MADLPGEMLSSLIDLFTGGKLSEARNEQTRLSILEHELKTLVYIVVLLYKTRQKCYNK
jgi:hypothetical protein